MKLNRKWINEDFVDLSSVSDKEYVETLTVFGQKVETYERMDAEIKNVVVGRLSCIFQGATDTTFYILAVYFGSVGVRKTRHAVTAGLLTDLCGVIAALVVGYIFFG